MSKFLKGLETNTIKITGGTPGSSKVLTSDGSGNATWDSPIPSVGTSAPSSPSDGDLWWDTDDSTDYGLLSNGTELRSFMQTSGKVIYPPSDITGYTYTTTAPTYSGAKSVLFNDANAALHFRYSGTWYNFSGNGMNQINGATAGSSAAWSSYEVEFYVNGADVTFWSVNAGVQSDYRIFVDDMPLTIDWQLNDVTAYNTTYSKIVFATSRMRKIRIFGSGLATFTGIIIPGASDIWAAPPRFRMAIIGDSYVQGNHDGGTEGFVSSATLCNQIAILTGWEVMNLGQGSTGYINNGGNTGGKDYYGASSRMTALAALPTLDLIMVYGSANDSSQTSGAVTTAVNSLWNAIKAARPTTPIVVAGIQPGSPAGFTVSLLDSTNTTIKAAAAANPNVAGFIDMRASGDNWVTGTGNAGTPVYDGNSDFFIGPDTVHPTRTGYSNMAWRMVQALGKIKV